MLKSLMGCKENIEKNIICIYISKILKNGKEELTLAYVVQKSLNQLTLCPNGTRPLKRWASRVPGCLNMILCSDGGVEPSPFFSSGISPHFQDVFPLTAVLLISLFQRNFFFWAMSPFICGIKGNKSCKLLILEVYMMEIQSLSSEPWNGGQSPSSC